MPLELSFNVEPDEHGVFDGRDLARQLVQVAYTLLTPYVHGCPACSDALFGQLANGVIADLHAAGGELPGAIYAREGPDKGARKRAHLETASAGTAALVRAQLGQDHQH